MSSAKTSIEELRKLSLLDFIPVLSPEFQSPVHLSDWCGMIERCLKGGVRAMCAVPIRHFKTWTTLHGIAWLLIHNPKLRIILMCADHERATELGKMCRRLCDAAGVGPVRGDNIILDWKNDQGGGVVCMSAEQSKLGRDVDILLVDDPITEHTADDAEVREAVDHSISHYTARAQRAGALGSVLIVMTPWHPDDPVGRRIARTAVTWEYVRHPAIKPDGTAFAPHVIDVDALRQIRLELAEQDPTERLWFSQFQCQPFVPGREVFGEPGRYVELPSWPGYRDGIGIDMSFSISKKADYFALVAGRLYGGTIFLREVQRVRSDIEEMTTAVRGAWQRFGRCTVYTYYAGPELGAIQHLTLQGLPIQGMTARFNKDVRAQKTRQRWNSARVLIPEGAAWATQFVRRVKLFRGAESDQDDEVDALVSLHDGMIGSAVAPPSAMGERRWA